MASRMWSRHANSMSHLIPSCHRLLCNNLSSSVASFAPEDRYAVGAAALEEDGRTSEKKKERLSRQERTALVESFVIKHLEAHGGAFPSVSAVLKETGGGRSAVKDILNDVESRFTQLTSRETVTSSDGRSTIDGAMEESFGVGPASAEVFGQDALMSSGTSSDDREYSDEEFDTEDVSNEETIEELGGISEAERKSVTFTNGQMIGSSHGEIETHSGLWSRLKKLGSLSKQQPSSQGSPSVALNGSSNDSTKECGVTPGFVALSFSNVTELNIRSLQNQQLEERHGLFVRYLSPQATPNDLKEAFGDCGEIVRAQAIKPRTHQKYTYGFVDFKTAKALQKALEKDKVYIKGVRIRKEPSSSTPKTPDRNGKSSLGDVPSTRNADDSSGSFLGPSRAKKIRGAGFTVAVEGVPLHIPLTEVQKALSKYGEITSSSRKEVGHGDHTAILEFKGDGARERALSGRTVHLSGMQYTISRLDLVKTSVVRLSNVGAGVRTVQIQAACELIGRVEKVVTRCDGIVDVYFHSTELENMPRIMSRLNEVKVGGELLQAQPSSSIDLSSYLSLMRTRDGEEWLHQESERMLGRVESALKHLMVDVEDLLCVVKMKREYTPL
ncbi:hypothetical protein KC19_VG325500 [Ceratodon purpureus]|uniref:RRM domain-containing protein n=1 Tax=Ceratodon purpureus TaxID=3225 RepID=A0A8T0HWY6_CERPU|nr:hypothetical protein KC19_VG325500 [Ceratodon purpureus]